MRTGATELHFVFEVRMLITFAARSHLDGIDGAVWIESTARTQKVRVLFEFFFGVIVAHKTRAVCLNFQMLHRYEFGDAPLVGRAALPRSHAVGIAAHLNGIA
jgi:hypothetical protein